MEVSNVSIKNFRSIEDISIGFNKIANKSALILLGINEVGKSNILKAVSLLDADRLNKIEYLKDCNKKAEEEGEDIEIVYELKVLNLDFYKKKYLEKGYPEDIVNSIKIDHFYKNIYIDKDNNKSANFHIYLTAGFNYSTYVIKGNDITLISKHYSGGEKITDDNIKELVGVGHKILTQALFEEQLESKFTSLYLTF